MGFGLCAAGTPGLDFRKNTKKKSSAKKLHRADSSPTAYDWFSILSLSLIYIYVCVCMYVCMHAFIMTYMHLTLYHSSYWTRNCSDFQSKIEVQRSSEFGILPIFVLFRQTSPSSWGRAIIKDVYWI